MPPEWNSVPSVCLSVWVSLSVAKTFYFGHYFWTVRDRDFIFGMHSQLLVWNAKLTETQYLESSLSK